MYSLHPVVRVGDSFQAGVTVQLLPAENQTDDLKTSVQVRVEVITEQGLQLVNGINFQKVTIPFYTPTYIFLKLCIYSSQ